MTTIRRPAAQRGPSVRVLLAGSEVVGFTVYLRYRARSWDMFLVKTLGLFLITAIAEIVGCYLPYLWLTKGAPVWVLLPAAGSLALLAEFHR